MLLTSHRSTLIIVCDGDRRSVTKTTRQAKTATKSFRFVPPSIIDMKTHRLLGSRKYKNLCFSQCLFSIHSPKQIVGLIRKAWLENTFSLPRLKIPRLKSLFNVEASQSLLPRNRAISLSWGLLINAKKIILHVRRRTERLSSSTKSNSWVRFVTQIILMRISAYASGFIRCNTLRRKATSRSSMRDS